eukprot:5530761-Pleurochrysis_carterae.AAC.2
MRRREQVHRALRLAAPQSNLRKPSRCVLPKPRHLFLDAGANLRLAAATVASTCARAVRVALVVARVWLQLVREPQLRLAEVVLGAQQLVRRRRDAALVGREALLARAREVRLAKREQRVHEPDEPPALRRLLGKTDDGRGGADLLQGVVKLVGRSARAQMRGRLRRGCKRARVRKRVEPATRKVLAAVYVARRGVIGA